MSWSDVLAWMTIMIPAVVLVLIALAGMAAIVV